MTLLSRLQTLGIAKEVTPATWLAPIRAIPVSAPKPEDLIEVLRDESLRGNDTVVQGIYGGASHSAVDYTVPHLYPDVLGDHLRAILGPDTLTAGISTTMSSASIAGATSISVAASIPSGSTISIGSGLTQEYVVTTAVSGAGPYVLTVPALANAHASASPVLSQSTHVFAQDQRANPIPTYSLTQYNKIEYRGYAGCVESDFGLKIDPKGAVSGDAKWQGFPSATQTTTVPAFSQVQPFLGWQWTLTLAGVASTRAVTGDFSFKRATAPINSSDGTQGPREVWAGALEADFKMKAIFENNNDLTAFLAYNTVPLVNILTQPLAYGGAVLTITSSGQKATKFAPDFSGEYLQADIEETGAFNATDSGLATITLKNFVNTAY